MNRSSIATVYLSGLILVFTGCSILDTEEPTNPFFQAAVSGEINGGLEGQQALFGEFDDAEFDQNVFLFEFVSDIRDAGMGITFVGVFEDDMEPGTYEVIRFVRGDDGETDQAELLSQLEPGQFIAEYVMTEQDASRYEDQFYSEQGTIELEEKDGSMMAGEFDFTANGFLSSAPDDTVQISVEGVFDASESEFETQD